MSGIASGVPTFPIVAQGTPEEIAAAEGSYTGRFLREVLARRPLRAREAAE